MSDTHSKEIRSKNMAAITSKNTKPEMLIRKSLHIRGFRYGLYNKKLPGRPDLHLRKYNAVLFVNGCFWHVHDCHLFKQPKSNKEYWSEKLEKNKKRDQKNIKHLLEIRKRVCVIWECSLKGKTNMPLEEVISSITKWLKSDKRYLEIEGDGVCTNFTDLKMDAS